MLALGEFCSWRRNHCVRGGFRREVVVGVIRGRAIGGISGPRFRQLPFPGVSPQPPQFHLSVTRRSGEIRRDSDPGARETWAAGKDRVCVYPCGSVWEEKLWCWDRQEERLKEEWVSDSEGSVRLRLRGYCDPGALTTRGLWLRRSCLRGVCDPAAVNPKGLWRRRTRGRGCVRTVTEEVWSSDSGELWPRANDSTETDRWIVTVRGLWPKGTWSNSCEGTLTKEQ